MIKICATWKEGQGQYNENVMDYHAGGSHHAKFDDDDFNSFRGITSEGQTHRRGLDYVNFFKVLTDFENKKACTEKAKFSILKVGPFLQMAFIRDEHGPPQRCEQSCLPYNQDECSSAFDM